MSKQDIIELPDNTIDGLLEKQFNRQTRKHIKKARKIMKGVKNLEKINVRNALRPVRVISSIFKKMGG